MPADKRNIIPKSTYAKKKSIDAKATSFEPYSNGKYFIPVFIFLLCMLLYANTISNGYALDDGLVTYSNEFIVKGFSAFRDIFSKGSLYGWNKTLYAQQSPYRPLPLLSFMAEVSVFGLNPHVSHFFNVLLFAFTIVILYYFLRRILAPMDNPGKNYNPVIALTATLLFVFHPIHTEVVANIKSRDEILSFLFGLISFYFIILYEQIKKNWYYFISLIAFCAALFCKETALSYLIIIPLLLYFFTPLELRKIVIKTIPYFGLVCIYLFIRTHVLKTVTMTAPLNAMDNTLMAANNSADRIATSFVLLGKYIYMTIVPYPLSFDYSFNQIPVASWTNWRPLLSLLVCIILIGYMFWRAKAKSIYSFLIAFFFITLFLTSNLVIRFACTFAERFLYIPSLSFCIAVPVLYAKLIKLDTLQSDWKRKIKFYVPFSFLLILYALIIVPQNTVWKNNITLFSSGVITSPASGLTHALLGGLYLDSAQSSKDKSKASLLYSLTEKEFNKAVEIYPGRADWHYNLGICYSATGNIDSAIIAYKNSLITDPKYYLAANNLGVLYMNKTLYDSALIYLNMSYSIDSGLYTLLNIGNAYQNKKNYALALHFDSLAFKKDPGNRQTQLVLSELHNEVGAQFVNNNELDKGLEEFSLALKCDSTSSATLGNMGVVYQKMGDINKAKLFYKKAIEKDPSNQFYANYLQTLNNSH